jgi:hypothetical protein
MPKKSAAHLKKVNEAVQILNTTTGPNVPQAMILDRFPKKDTANKIVCRMIRRHLEALKAKQNTPPQDALTAYGWSVTNYSIQSPLTGATEMTRWHQRQGPRQQRAQGTPSQIGNKSNRLRLPSSKGALKI